MFSIKSRRPLFISLGLCLALCLGLGLGYLTSHVFSEDAKFQKFTRQLFQSEVNGSTLNLHYTLAHPEDYKVASEQVTLGTIPTDPARKLRTVSPGFLLRRSLQRQSADFRSAFAVLSHGTFPR